jgi:hypothetical protein
LFLKPPREREIHLVEGVVQGLGRITSLSNETTFIQGA